MVNNGIRGKGHQVREKILKCEIYVNIIDGDFSKAFM
jgi:hypothetical protein